MLLDHMVKRSLPILAAILVVHGGVACKKKPTVDSAAIQKKFQDAQRHRAIKAYDEIVAKYPDSPYAVKAKTRARLLQTEAGIQPQAPTKK
jgi:outer membrane protein assembly factor BamD (BamD/ComL family)